MSRVAADYRDQYFALQPPGIALPTDNDTNWAKLLEAFGEEFARIDARATSLLNEIDPRTTDSLLEDFERMLALPDPCLPAPGTTQERRNAVVARLNALGGASAQYFIDVAAAYGYTITINELGSNVWQIESPIVTVTEFTCISPCTDPLQTSGNDQLECFIDQFKPAHTRVEYITS